MTPEESDLVPTMCAICGTDAHDSEKYPAHFAAKDFSAHVFSARRLPDKVHYRIVTCGQCGLIRSNPVLPPAKLAGLYQASHFTYPAEADAAAETYGRFVQKFAPGLTPQSRILEVGCGNGTFIRWLYDRGYTAVHGVEPSVEAVAAAGPVKGFIHTGMFGPGIYPDASFDAICAFQVFDHLPDPAGFLQDCRRYLKDSGVLIMIMHDAGAPANRMLGRSSPIVDIEHPFLYNASTLTKILGRNGFHDLRVVPVSNRYALSYWARLLPVSPHLKDKVVSFLARPPLAEVSLSLRAGNMGVVAYKRDDQT